MLVSDKKLFSFAQRLESRVRSVLNLDDTFPAYPASPISSEKARGRNWKVTGCVTGVCRGLGLARSLSVCLGLSGFLTRRWAAGGDVAAVD